MSYLKARKPVRIQALARRPEPSAALPQRRPELCNPSALAAADHPTARRPIRRANMSLADQWARLCAELQCSGAVRAKGDEMLTRLTDDRLESSQARLAA